jgi:hypothetical protein
VLREQLAAARPNVLVVFGDDQGEAFDFSNFPAFAVYVGDQFEGELSAGDFARYGANRGGTGPHTGVLVGHPALATAILTGVMERGFDPGFLMEPPKPEEGMGHAFMRPVESLTDMRIPVVPVLVNCFFAPQPSAARCYAFGQAVLEAIEAYPEDLRVAVVGSGGLWHTPGTPDAYLDEAFDHAILDRLRAGDVRGMAECFDSYCVPEGDRSQDISQRSRLSTGMPSHGGPQSGTREVCNWIAASVAAEGQETVVVDYVPVYASPIGISFTYWLAA